ncbi:MAG: hypothetical protein FRX49_03779 [Trebouxia sp. A1-2]|nr:MAG: hypothetical protein FRX49_13572 [Trebouxia sp. A1-2]KAA6426669.1 MAG: hypothetical protein FRX49_03779 [Trebouxia sp. A1-2]
MQKSAAPPQAGSERTKPTQPIPAATISDLDCAYRGSTKPGQSHRVRSLVMLRVWKCLVLPGVGATAVFLEPKRALIVEDLPTLGYPGHQLTLSCEAVNASLGRPEDILHSGLVKVVSPGTAQRSRQQVCFVQQQHRAFGGVQLHRVAFKVLRATYLHNNVTTLKDPPQLAPDFQVFLKRSQYQALIIFQPVVHTWTNFWGHVSGPRWSPRDPQSAAKAEFGLGLGVLHM